MLAPCSKIHALIKTTPTRSKTGRQVQWVHCTHKVSSHRNCTHKVGCSFSHTAGFSVQHTYTQWDHPYILHTLTFNGKHMHTLTSTFRQSHMDSLGASLSPPVHWKTQRISFDMTMDRSCAGNRHTHTHTQCVGYCAYIWTHATDTHLLLQAGSDN